MIAVLLAVFIFDPIGWRFFLLDARYAATIRPIALAAGIVGAIGSIYVVGRAHWRLQEDVAAGRIKEGSGQYNQFKAVENPVKLIFVLISSPLLGFGGTYLSIKTVIPIGGHYLSERHEFHAPFLIKGFYRTKMCRGVRAWNAEFYDNEICGVSWRGNIAPYLDKKMIVYGERSTFGIMLERYTLPELPARDQSSSPSTPKEAGRRGRSSVQDALKR